MKRGYDLLHNPVGIALIVSSLLLTIAVVVWGSFHFKRKIAQDEARRAALRAKRAQNPTES